MTACAALALAAASAPAGATLLQIVPTAGSTWELGDPLPGPELHDVAETAGLDGWYYANLQALADVDLVFTFLGMEAGWTDVLKLTADGAIVFENQTTPPGTTADGGSALAGDWIDFTLQVLLGGNAPLTVSNGANNEPTGVPSGIDSYGALNFWLGYVDASHDEVYVAFDDGGGFWNGSIDDDDHDDLVFKITAIAREVPTSVPEPATLSLLGAGLVLVGFAGRRRKV